MRLADMKIATKILSVIVFLGFVSVCIAVTGSYGINRMVSEIDKINASTKEIRLGAQAYINILFISRGEYRAAVAPDEMDEIAPLIEKYKQQFEIKLADLQSSFGDEYKTEMQLINSSYRDYIRMSDKTFDTANKHKGLEQDAERKEIYDAVIAARAKATKVTDLITYRA